MSATRFSAVIPLYNKAQHIQETVNSVLGQTLQDLEVVVVDDGSTDGGAEIVSRIPDSRVRLIKQENAGVSAARNRGVQEATGEYVAFLDADDEWLPWHLEELDRLIRACPNCGLYSVGHEIVQSGRRYRPSTGTDENFFGIVEDVFRAFSDAMALANSSTACVPRERFWEAGGFPVGATRGEDIYLWLVLGLNSCVAHSARVCVRVNRDAVNRSNDSLNPEIHYYLLYLDRLFRENRLEQPQVPSARQLFRRGVIFSSAGFAVDGNRKALAAMRAIPSSKDDTVVRIALAVLRMTPRGMLRALRRYRHKRSVDIEMQGNGGRSH